MESLTHSMAEIDHSQRRVCATWPTATSAWSSEFRTRDGYAIEAQVGTVLDGLGFRKEDWHRRTEEFSGGWQMRIALAKLLLQKPNLLLLDEPTNHLDLEARNWLEEYLHELSLRVRPDLARPLFSRRHRRQDRRRSGTSGSTSTAATTKNICRRRRSAARSWRRHTRTSGTASSSSKPSSIAFATRPRRPSRCRAASRNSRRSSASRFRRKRRRFTSPSRSRSRAGASWPKFQGVSKSYGAKEVFRNVEFHH